MAFFKYLLRSSFVLFLGTAVASVCNYLFTLTMGRMLGPANYGIIVSLFALLSILTVPSATIQTVAAKFSAVFLASQSFSKINFIFKYLTKKFFILGLLATLLLIIFSQSISRILNLPSASPLVVISLSLIFIFLLPINRGILQGLQKFKILAINGTVEALVKLIFGLLLVFLGLSVNGAVLAVVLASFLAYLLTFPSLKKIFISKEQKAETKELKIYAGTSLIAFLFLTLIINQDVLLVKYFFRPEEAGLYAALATMGKIVLFLSAPVAGVMFPIIADLYERKEKHYPVLIGSFFLVLILSLAVLTVYFIAPGISIKILFGSSYLAIAPYLTLFGFAVLLYSLANLLASYFLSLGKKVFLWPLSFSVILEFILIWFYHQNFLDIIKILIFVMGLVLAAFIFIYLWDKKKQILALAKDFNETLGHHSRLQ